MPADRVTLTVGGKRIESFLAFRIEADLYTAEDGFSLDLSHPETEIKAGDRCELHVNDEPVLTGIIDRVVKGYEKRGVSLQVEGRDLMGLLVDSCCEEFVTVEGKKLSELAERLLKTVPFISRKDIVYQEDVVGKLEGTRKAHQGTASLEMLDVPQKFSQIEPGMTVFEVLSTYSRSRGLMFFALPDGTFVFGRPKAKGEPIFSVTCKKPGPANNILRAEKSEDISRSYSKVTVIGQQQGLDEFGMDSGEVNTTGSATNEDFPFYKPFVTTNNSDSLSPSQHARLLIEKMRRDGNRLEYRVKGLTQNGRPWTINELCRVEDEELGISGVWLVFARRLEMDRNGVFATVRLGPPGLVI